MAKFLTVTEFMEMDPRVLAPLKFTCVDCEVVLQGDTTGYYNCTDGTRCSDCYFQVLGELMETGRGDLL